jgi:hypothetical protein
VIFLNLSINFSFSLMSAQLSSILLPLLVDHKLIMLAEAGALFSVAHVTDKTRCILTFEMALCNSV